MSYWIETVKKNANEDFLHNGKIYGLTGNLSTDTAVGMAGLTSHNYIFLENPDLSENPIREADLIFIAKIEAARDPDSTVFLKESGQIHWGSDQPDRGSDCSRLLKEARIGEVYDNAVEFDIAVFKGNIYSGLHYTLTAYCYYDNEECLKPVIGGTYIDVINDNIVEEVSLPLTDKEKQVLQEVLDRTEFRQYQFGNEVVTIEEEEEREI